MDTLNKDQKTQSPLLNKLAVQTEDLGSSMESWVEEKEKVSSADDRKFQSTSYFPHYGAADLIFQLHLADAHTGKTYKTLM